MMTTPATARRPAHRGAPGRLCAAALAVLVLGLGPGAGDALAQTSARAMYTAALARERALRHSQTPPALRDLRGVIAAYDAIVRRHPRSGYSDNALWQAAGLALEAYDRFGEDRDRAGGVRRLEALRREYPSSSLVRSVPDRLKQFEAASRRLAARRAAPPPRSAAAPAPRQGQAPAAGTATIRDIRRMTMPEGVRVIVELDARAAYREERLQNPPRVFFDFSGTTVSETLADTDLGYADELIREIRLGRHPDRTTRLVMELSADASHRVFALADPYRLVIDFQRPSAAAGPAPAATTGAATTAGAVETGPAGSPPPLPASPAAVASASAPPEANSSGKYSLARQLGLGVSRVVIDPGHGGQDPGALGPRITEAEVVLDVALRLEKLLLARPGFEVVMTRRSDVFVPLEERTAIANRANADLFLSIHANASRNPQARGVETYFLNFASNPEAEAVAARENSASGRTMHNLPDIVRAIALNNKLDESRDFAGMIQQALVRRLSAENRDVRNLGVKQAPFVVLIGAGMPSVLAEISFITNRAEAQLLRTPAYRQRIAQGLFDAIVEYQRSLKQQTTVAAVQHDD